MRVPADRFSIAGLGRIYKLGEHEALPSAASVPAPCPAGAALPSDGDHHDGAAARQGDTPALADGRPRSRKGVRPSQIQHSVHQIRSQVDDLPVGGGRPGPSHMAGATVTDRPPCNWLGCQAEACGGYLGLCEEHEGEWREFWGGEGA